MSKDVLSNYANTTASTNPVLPSKQDHKDENLASELYLDFQDEHMQKLLQICKKVASTNACILVVGETSTGKKALGQHIHNLSGKMGEVSYLNISEVSPDNQTAMLLDTINDAAGSTVVIENVDKLTEQDQIQFNAILKNQVTLPKPTRIIATTEADLTQAIRNGKFFKELYYRLNVIRLEVPALRQRKKDILGLALNFLNSQTENTYRLSEDAQTALLKHNWTGNIQELKNVIARARLLTTKAEISLSCLEIGNVNKTDNHWVEHLPVGKPLKDVETHFILKTLIHHNGNRTHSAKTLGISLRTLRNKINEFNAEGLEVAEPTKGKAHT